MYTFDDLFDKRGIVGSKLNYFIKSKVLKKSYICKAAGISRPTLDKLLTGEVAIKANFCKHVEKLFAVLDITPDMLMSNVNNPFVQITALQHVMHFSTEDIVIETGISTNRIMEIASGGKATVIELRDIAYCLGSSVAAILGETYFFPQYVYMPPDSTQELCSNARLDGYWGDVGILPSGSKTYIWFPITTRTYKKILSSIDQDFLAVPCINNKILLIQMKNIQDMILLDEACDALDNTNWNYNQMEHYPLVVYEALEDYIHCNYMDKKKNMSEKLRLILDSMIKTYHLTENSICDMLYGITIHHNDGSIHHDQIAWSQEESISFLLHELYCFDQFTSVKNILQYENSNSAVHLLPLNNISVLEVPLLMVEKAIAESFLENDSDIN